MTTKQISVFLENQPGKLAELTACLSAQKINLRAISVAEASDFGIVRLLVDDVLNAVSVLRGANYVCSITDVLAVEVKDEPGALAEMVTVLGAVNVEYMYAVTAKKENAAYMVVRVNDSAAAAKALTDKGFKTVSL